MRRLLGLCAVAVAVALWFCSRDRATPPLPANLDDLDPDVRSLIRETVGNVRDAPSWARLGMVYEANGQIELAQQCYESSIARDEKAPRVWHRLALVRSRVGDLDGALEAETRVLLLEPTYAPAHGRKGFWLLDKGNLQDAQAAFEAVLRIDSKDPSGRLGLARVHLQRNESERARDLLEEHLTLRPGDRYALQLLGTAYRRLGQLEDAAVALAVGVRGEPAFPDPWSNEVASHRRGFAALLKDAGERFTRGDGEGAISILERLRKEKPNDVTLLNHLAAAYLASGRTDQCLALLEAALRLAPENADSQIGLARAYLSRREYERASSHVETALSLAPDSSQAHAVKGEIEWARQNAPAALESFESAAARDPRDLAVQVRIGMLQRELGKWQEALRTFESAAARDPTLGEAFIGIAMVQLDRRRWDDAGDALRRAKLMGAGDVRIRELELRLESALAGQRR